MGNTSLNFQKFKLMEDWEQVEFQKLESELEGLKVERDNLREELKKAVGGGLNSIGWFRLSEQRWDLLRRLQQELDLYLKDFIILLEELKEVLSDARYEEKFKKFEEGILQAIVKRESGKEGNGT